MVFFSLFLSLSSAPSLQGLILFCPPGKFMISLRSECLLVALGSQPQLSLPVTGKEAGTGMEQALSPCPPLWSPQWHACQKAKPHLT